jgi:hypothetical protein
MKPTLQAELTPGAVQPGITFMFNEFRAPTELEMDSRELLTLQHEDGDNAALECESSNSYEERFAELLSLFLLQGECAAALGIY